MFISASEIVILSWIDALREEGFNLLRSWLQAPHKTSREMTCETSHVKLRPAGAENEMATVLPPLELDLISIITITMKYTFIKTQRAISASMKKKTKEALFLLQ